MNDCTPDRPVCDTGTCRGCAVDSECASTVCDVDTGRCVPAEQIRYAQSDGLDSADCSQLTPCSAAKSLATVDATHTWVRFVPGTYSATLTVASGCTIVGTGADLGMHGLTAQGGAVVRVRGLSAFDYVCTDASLDLAALAAGNIAAEPGCQLRVEETAVGPGQLYVSDSTSVTVDRSNISAIDLNPVGTAPISIIATSSIFRQALLSNGTVSSASIVFAFNTFYFPGGQAVACGADSITPPGILFVDNIFYSVGVGSGNSVQTAGANCNFDTNVIFPQSLVIGTNNILADPLFADAAHADLHLTNGSPAVDAAKTTANDPTADLDGTRRPQRVRLDIGAYELP